MLKQYQIADNPIWMALSLKNCDSYLLTLVPQFLSRWCEELFCLAEHKKIKDWGSTHTKSPLMVAEQGKEIH